MIGGTKKLLLFPVVAKGLALLREGVQLLINNYPEAMHRIVIINGNTLALRFERLG